MKRLGFDQASVFAFLLSLLTFAILALAVGCNVGAGAPGNYTDASGSQQLPFTEGKTLVVPANTSIYVRLQQSISSATAQAGQDFTAVLDEPLVVDGQTVAPEGAPVTGKIVAASESGHKHGASYLRITLSLLTLNGKTLPLQTNSVFVGGGSFKKHNLTFTGGGAGGSFLGAVGDSTAAYTTENKEVGFMADRRLGFRLTQPIIVPRISVP
jgi:hypothetical protein